MQLSTLWPGFLSWAPQLFTRTVALSLEDVCNPTYVQGALPPGGFLRGIAASSSSVTANAVTNYTVIPSTTSPGKSGLDFCNVTFSYSHSGLKDNVRKTHCQGMESC